MNACQKLMARLEMIIKNNEAGRWEDWIEEAYKARISLSATGFYAIPGVGYDMETNTGNVCNYHTYGVGCSVVEIDCLTGDHAVLKTNIVMDLGESMNPAIDVGQIEGAFMQGYGLFVLEQLLHSPSGKLLTRGPGNYKIPSFGDIPREFNVSLLRGSSEPRAVYSSKAVGEPPLFLAASVFFAIKNAIVAAREDNGISDPYNFQLDAPATCERIRMGCEDEITRNVPKIPESDAGWSIQL